MSDNIIKNITMSLSIYNYGSLIEFHTLLAVVDYILAKFHVKT